MKLTWYQRSVLRLLLLIVARLQIGDEARARGDQLNHWEAQQDIDKIQKVVDA
jgi:hypothetical protein